LKQSSLRGRIRLRRHGVVSRSGARESKTPGFLTSRIPFAASLGLTSATLVSYLFVRNINFCPRGRRPLKGANSRGLQGDRQGL
jgi:hypothetical protein